MTRIWARAFRGLVLLFVGLASSAAMANEEPPGRVARLSEYFGGVYVAPEDQASDWQPIGRNHPITTGDNVWVTPEGRAELDFGAGQVRLGGDSNVHFAQLDDITLSMFIASGRVIVRLRYLDAGETVRLDTPSASVFLNRAGLYRVNVEQGGEVTSVMVREGSADVSSRNGNESVSAGTVWRATGRDNPQVGVYRLAGGDGFDAWSLTRDRRYESSRSAGYVSAQMVGWRDLDDYGYWDRHASYGTVWYPTTVAVGWAPYRNGRWSWVRPWGWTWVDDAPWGFAPFHYGRWVNVAGRWGWCPGAVNVRPYYAPALVAWYGGPGWSAGINVGGPVYGWVPLGWGDPYLPHYRISDDRWHAYNRPYGVNRAERPNAPPTRYSNYAVPGAITAVSEAAFTGSRSVSSHRVNLSPSQLAGAPAVTSLPSLHKPREVTSERARPGGSIPRAASSAPVYRPGVSAVPPAVNDGRRREQIYPAPGSPGGSVTAVPPASRPIPREGYGDSPRPSPGVTSVPPATRQRPERAEEIPAARTNLPPPVPPSAPSAVGPATRGPAPVPPPEQIERREEPRQRLQKPGSDKPEAREVR